MHDLHLIISNYENYETLESIDLLQHDAPDTLITPQKCYGHHAYSQTLLSALDMAATSFEIIFIAGESGSGKAALVCDMCKSVLQKDQWNIHEWKI